MPHPFRLALGLLVATGSLKAADEWTDRAGGSFRGRPVEALGPLALFSTDGGGRKLAFRFLTPDDCVRFREAVKTKQPRAPQWSGATGHLTAQLIGKVKRVDGDRLVDETLAGKPEPEVVIVFYVDNSEGKSWEMLGRAMEPFQKLRTRFPGEIEGLFFGVNHGASDHATMAIQMKVPWLVADYHDQMHHLEDVRAFAPGASGQFALVALSRDGVPLFSVQRPGPDDIDKLLGDVGGLLELIRSSNPKSWLDEVYYERAVRAHEFAHGHADPVLVGDPLVSEGLRDRKIFEVSATITVDAEGKVTNVTLKSGLVAPAMEAPLAEALRRSAAIVPAIQDGKFVPGTLEYHKTVPH